MIRFPESIFKIIILAIASGTIMYAGEHADSARKGNNPTPEQAAGVPPRVRSIIGDCSAGWDGRLRLVNIGKRQQYDYADKTTLDTDVYSPKSVNFHPDGSRCYVNSLEGCKTVVYNIPGFGKQKVISHGFPSGRGDLWAAPSGYYPFTHYENGDGRAFHGKPVEGVFSHHGKYLWVPYYRRTFDINAQDPSAVAVIDTATDSIVRMFETGPLPKMAAYSPSIERIAITHWGDNTVGFIDVSDDIDAWHHLRPLAAGSKLHLDFPLDRPVNRDSGAGLKLRGTVFTPDGRYLLVGAMGGAMQIFDMARHEYSGHINSAYGIRHLIIKNGILYGSQNIAGSVVAVALDSVETAIERAYASGSRDIRVNGWRSCKVGSGARTLEASPDGELLFVACNSASEVCVVETGTMTVVDRIRVDSYPVGLDVSDDGTLLAVTSQGRKKFGGNAVNFFRIDRPGTNVIGHEAESSLTLDKDTERDAYVATEDDDNPEVEDTKWDFCWRTPVAMIVPAIGIALLLAVLGLYIRNRKKR